MKLPSVQSRLPEQRQPDPGVSEPEGVTSGWGNGVGGCLGLESGAHRDPPTRCGVCWQPAWWVETRGWGTGRAYRPEGCRECHLGRGWLWVRTTSTVIPAQNLPYGSPFGKYPLSGLPAQKTSGCG